MNSATAPGGMPQNFVSSPINSREMRFTWSPPEPTLRNGIITGYNLTCFITATGMGQIGNRFPPQENYRLSGFRPATGYTCRVVAINSAGRGPPAERMDTSPEDGKEVCFATRHCSASLERVISRKCVYSTKP